MCDPNLQFESFDCLWLKSLLSDESSQIWCTQHNQRLEQGCKGILMCLTHVQPKSIGSLQNACTRCFQCIWAFEITHLYPCKVEANLPSGRRSGFRHISLLVSYSPVSVIVLATHVHEIEGVTSEEILKRGAYMFGCWVHISAILLQNCSLRL